MKIKLKPVEVSHVSIKALLLYEQELAQEFERISTLTNGYISYHYPNNKATAPLERIKDHMRECQKAREYLEKHWINQQEPEDKTEY